MATTEPTARAVPSKNPLPLSAQQEAQVRDLYYKKVRGICAEEIRKFAECARGRTFSATWACKQEREGMNRCMVAHATQENQDAAREEWFKMRMEKKRLREEEEARKRAAEAGKA